MGLTNLPSGEDASVSTIAGSDSFRHL
jgi:hypothetical protein